MTKKRSVTNKGLFGQDNKIEAKTAEVQNVDENEAFQSKLELQRKVIKNLEAILNNKASEMLEHHSKS